MLPLLFWILDSTEAGEADRAENINTWADTPLVEWGAITSKIGQSKPQVKCMVENCDSLTSCTCKCKCTKTGGFKENDEHKRCKVQCWMARLCGISCEMITEGVDKNADGKTDLKVCKEKCTNKAGDMKAAIGTPEIANKREGNYTELRTLIVEQIDALPNNCMTKREAFQKVWMGIYNDNGNLTESVCENTLVFI